NGRVDPMSAPSMQHQRVTTFLVALLHFYVESRSLGTALAGPYLMRLRATNTARIPDVLFVSHEREPGSLYMDGAADLVIEIVSLHDRRRDTHTKREEYEKAGVREYWIVDPKRQEATFYILDENGRYQREPLTSEGVYRSRVVAGFFLRTAWLW